MPKHDTMSEKNVKFKNFTVKIFIKINIFHVTQRHISTNPKTVGLAVISLESE